MQHAVEPTYCKKRCEAHAYEGSIHLKLLPHFVVPLLCCIHLALHLLQLLTQLLHLPLHIERLSFKPPSIHFSELFASPLMLQLQLQRLHAPLHTHSLRSHGCSQQLPEMLPVSKAAHIGNSRSMLSVLLALCTFRN